MNDLGDIVPGDVNDSNTCVGKLLKEALSEIQLVLGAAWALIFNPADDGVSVVGDGDLAATVGAAAVLVDRQGDGIVRVLERGAACTVSSIWIIIGCCSSVRKGDDGGKSCEDKSLELHLEGEVDDDMRWFLDSGKGGLIEVIEAVGTDCLCL